MATTRQRLEQAENAEPIYTNGGTKIYSYEDYVALAEQGLRDHVDLGGRTLNADGSPARSKTPFAATNPERLYANRYRIKTNKLFLVTAYKGDTEAYRAISEQNSGRIHVAHLPAYVFARGKDNELVLERRAMVSQEEFVSAFTGSLSVDLMKQIAPLIDNSTVGSTVTEEMPL